MPINQIKHSELIEDKPPALSSWKQWYAAVLSFLIFQIAVYFMITKIFG